MLKTFEVIQPAGSQPAGRLDIKLFKLQQKAAKDKQLHDDLMAVLDFIKANPWTSIVGSLILVDLLRYLGVISKAKSSDIAVIIAGLGVATTGGGSLASALAALIGGSFMWFPDNEREAGKPIPPVVPPGTPGAFPIIPPPKFGGPTGPIQV